MKAKRDAIFLAGRRWEKGSSAFEFAAAQKYFCCHAWWLFGGTEDRRTGWESTTGTHDLEFHGVKHCSIYPIRGHTQTT